MLPFDIFRYPNFWNGITWEGNINKNGNIPDGTIASDSDSDSVSELDPTSSTLIWSYCWNIIKLIIIILLINSI